MLTDCNIVHMRLLDLFLFKFENSFSLTIIKEMGEIFNNCVVYVNIIFKIGDHLMAQVDFDRIQKTRTYADAEICQIIKYNSRYHILT